MCGAGKYNLFPGCIACSNTTDLDCTTCTLGTASTMLGRNTTCDVCEAGKYSHPPNQRGALTCEWCGIGLAAPNGSSNCVTCGDGRFAALGASACGVCPAGSFAVAPAGACTSCPPGTFSSGVGVSVCQVCQAGTFSSASGPVSSAACLSCQPGTYSSQRSSACRNCPANSWNLVLRSTRCTANVGFYNLDDSLRAYYPFNEGDFLTDVTGMTGNLVASASSPTQMVSGPFSATSYSAWFNGNANQYFTLPFLMLPNAMSICSWFWISPDITRKWNRVFDFGRGAGNENVLVSIVSSSGDLTADVYKQFSRMSHHYWQGGATASVWRHVCLTVSGTNGNFWLDNNPNAFTTVDNRNFNTELTKNYIGRSNWWHLDEVWRGAFDEFRIYHKALSATEVAALYAFSGDSTDSMIILACPNPCPGGTFGGCNGDGTQNCTACGRGLFSSGIGQTSPLACQNCFAGTYSFPANTNGASRCEPCGNGLAAPEGSSNCTTCGVGFYAAAGFSACVICPAGTFATGLISACSTCATGTYATQTGATTCQNCSTCSVGQYNVSNCNSSANVVCGTCLQDPGFITSISRLFFYGTGNNGPYSCPWYCIAGTAPSANGCWYCGANTWCQRNTVNSCPSNSGRSSCCSGNQDSCQCNPGFFGVGGWSNYSPLWPGQIQPPANWSGVNCESCPAGKYSTGTGVSMFTHCVSCVAGTYSTAAASGNSSSCISCLAGTYSTGISMPTPVTCISCPAGKYNTGVGVTTSAGCVSCVAGTYSTAVASSNSNSCISCLAGTYSTGLAMDAAATCISCNAGTYSSTSGATDSSRCQNCPRGKYAGVDGAFSENFCSLCDAGTFSSGLGATSSQNCSACQPGDYSGDGASVCQACVPGLYSLSRAPVCTPCAPGAFADQNRSSVCDPCASGTYSTGGASECLLCSTGLFSPGSVSVCSVCPAGAYNDRNGSENCTLCETGLYSTGGASGCLECSYGTFTSARGSWNCRDCENGQFSDDGASEVSVFLPIRACSTVSNSWF